MACARVCAGRRPIVDSRTPSYNRSSGGRGRSFADAEASKYFTQQVVAAEHAGDLSQGAMRQTQLFGQQIERFVRAGRQRRGLSQMRGGALQGLYVSGPGDELTLGVSMPAGPLE